MSINVNKIQKTELSKNYENKVDSSQKFLGTTFTDATVILEIATIRFRDMMRQFKPVRILLDCGSQISAMTSECTTRISLKRYQSQV